MVLVIDVFFHGNYQMLHSYYSVLIFALYLLFEQRVLALRELENY